MPETDKDDFMVKENGGKANAWSFSKQQVKDQKALKEEMQGNQELGAEGEQPIKESIEERVLRIARDQNIDLEGDQVIAKFKANKSEKKEANAEVDLKKNEEAKMHYDQSDLIMFHELKLDKPLVKACKDLDYEHPTIIQQKSIPAILEGHDVLAHSVTGSGKTASYLLPLLQKYLRIRQVAGSEIGKLRFLILQPTRELAAQCNSMLQSLSKYLPQSFKSLAVFGGSSLYDQKRQISFESPDVIVATTGRLLDHLKNTRGFSAEDVEVLVLDEADRLLEMGFKDQLMQIVGMCKNPNRQTLMFSATLNQDLKELA